jgi:beta-lactamase class C
MEDKMSIRYKKIECYYGLSWRILRAEIYPKTELICHDEHIDGVNTFVGFIPLQEMDIIILLKQTSKFPLWA